MTARPDVVGTVLAVIPCRRGSKRLPGKNTRTLCGRLMLDYTLAPALDGGLFDDVLVTTDDPAVVARARELGCPVDYERPAALAEDGTGSYDTVIHALDWYRDRAGGDPAVMVLLQVTSPLRPADCSARALALLAANPGADAVIGMRRVGVTSENVYVAPAEGEGPGLRRLQGGAADRQPLLVPNGAVYAVRVDAFRREKSFVPAKTLPLVMTPAESVDVDTLDDFVMVEALLTRLNRDGTTASLPNPTDR